MQMINAVGGTIYSGSEIRRLGTGLDPSNLRAIDEGDLKLIRDGIKKAVGIP